VAASATDRARLQDKLVSEQRSSPYVDVARGRWVGLRGRDGFLRRSGDLLDQEGNTPIGPSVLDDGLARGPRAAELSGLWKVHLNLLRKNGGRLVVI